MSVKVWEVHKNEVARQVAEELRGVGDDVKMWVMVADQAAAGPDVPIAIDLDAEIAAMDAHTVAAGDVDDSREAIYTRLEGA